MRGSVKPAHMRRGSRKKVTEMCCAGGLAAQIAWCWGLWLDTSRQQLASSEQAVESPVPFRDQDLPDLNYSLGSSYYAFFLEGIA